MVTFYETLGLQPSAGPDEIKKAYKSLALKYHPDRNTWDPQAEERFKQINEAYQTLSNPEKKRVYDSRFSTPPPPTEEERPYSRRNREERYSYNSEARENWERKKSQEKAQSEARKNWERKKSQESAQKVEDEDKKDTSFYKAGVIAFFIFVVIVFKFTNLTDGISVVDEINKGIVKYKGGSPKEAFHHFELAIENENGHPEASFLMAEMLSDPSIGRSDTAFWGSSEARLINAIKIVNDIEVNKAAFTEDKYSWDGLSYSPSCDISIRAECYYALSFQDTSYLSAAYRDFLFTTLPDTRRSFYHSKFSNFRLGEIALRQKAYPLAWSYFEKSFKDVDALERAIICGFHGIEHKIMKYWHGNNFYLKNALFESTSVQQMYYGIGMDRQANGNLEEACIYWRKAGEMGINVENNLSMYCDQ